MSSEEERVDASESPSSRHHQPLFEHQTVILQLFLLLKFFVCGNLGTSHGQMVSAGFAMLLGKAQSSPSSRWGIWFAQVMLLMNVGRRDIKRG